MFCQSWLVVTVENSNNRDPKSEAVVFLPGPCNSSELLLRGVSSKSTELFREDPSFSLSYDLAPPPPHLPSVSSTGGVTQKDWEKETICWREREVGIGLEPNHMTATKPNLYKSVNTLWVNCWRAPPIQVRFTLTRNHRGCSSFLSSSFSALWTGNR